MSVPYAPPGYVDVLSALEKLGINDFYLQYFQKPGVPEAELQQDIRGALRRIYFTAGGEFDEKGKGFARLTGGTLLANTVDPPTLPPWLSEADLDYYAQEFSRTGFRGGLNWYRNLRRNWELGGPWRGQPIRSRRCSSPAAATACCASRQPRPSSTPSPRRCLACAAATSSRVPAIGCSRSGRARSTNC